MPLTDSREAPLENELKKRIRALLGLFLWAAWGLGPLWGSETRVDSAGGITGVIDDETNNGDLFLDGNPAGLVLLKTHDRFDLAGQYTDSYSLPSGLGTNQQVITTFPRLSNDSVIRYEGLMLFPDPHWAVQLGGDLLAGYNNVAGNYYADTYNNQQYWDLLRVAYNAGPFAAGLEISNNELDNQYEGGLFSPTVGQSVGSNTEDRTRLRVGLITTFPENPGPDEPRWQLGGVFETQLGSDVVNFQGDRYDLGGASFALQQQNAMTQYVFFGPEVHYEVPGTLILRFYSFVTNDYTSFSQQVTPPGPGYPNLSPFVSSQYQSMNNFGSFRLTVPLTDTENLKMGGSLTEYLYNVDLLGTGHNVTTDENREQISGGFGIGLENPGHSTWGFQFTTQNYLYDHQAVSTDVLTASDYNLYQVALGGEKWVSPHVALRGGLIVEEDVYSQSADQTILATSAVAGLGYGDKGLKLDTKFLIGQEANLNYLVDNTYTLLLGVEIQGTLFL
jgi:hypothetical protein